MSMSLMKTLENNGLEKEDLKWKFIRKERVKLLLITRNMKDKLEVA